MPTSRNSHPNSIACGFCGHHSHWGSTGCTSCGADINYGMNAYRGVWFFIGHIAYALVVIVSIFMGIITLVGAATIIDTGARFLDASICFGIAAIAMYLLIKIPTRAGVWFARTTGIDKQWANQYSFSRVSRVY